MYRAWYSAPSVLSLGLLKVKKGWDVRGEISKLCAFTCDSKAGILKSHWPGMNCSCKKQQRVQIQARCLVIRVGGRILKNSGKELMLSALVTSCTCCLGEFFFFLDRKYVFMLHGLHIANISGGERPKTTSCSSWGLQADPRHRLLGSLRWGLSSDDDGISTGLRPTGQSQHLSWKTCPYA